MSSPGQLSNPDAGSTLTVSPRLPHGDPKPPDLQPTISVIGLEGPGAPGLATEPAGPRDAPRSIGGYRVLGLLGEGGMGIVWEAEQRHPRRRVALKVMRQEHLVDEAHARMFHHEAETLGRLRHPQIAAIYEAGHTDEGHDFFAMELVQGDTLDAWLRSRPAPAGREEILHRLAMFTGLCDAVHYAHQRGVIHGDLKPRNVIVTHGAGPSAEDGAFGTLKILDFGLARIADVDGSPRSPRLETGAVRGTLAYMSPEQARGDTDAIDLRTDVYSLGVILYEMLTSSRPFDLDGASLREAVRLVSHTPPRPLRTSWGNAWKLHPDLECIVARALARDPADRYGSAAALAEDVRSFLAFRPIAARRWSTPYRAARFARRHRLGVAAAAIVALSVVAGLVGTVSGLVRARQAESLARSEAAESERVSRFIADMLASVDPHRVGAWLVTDLEDQVTEAARRDGASEEGVAAAVEALRQVLADVSSTETGRRLVDRAVLSRACDAVAERFGDQPEVAGRLEHTLAETYDRLGLYDQALALARRATTNRAATLGPDDPATLASQSLLATVRYRMGRFQEAEELLIETLRRQRLSLGADHPDTLGTARTLSWVHIEQGRLEEAERLLVPTIEAQRRTLGEDHPETMTSVNSLAVVLSDQRRFAEAEALHGALLAARSRTLGPTHPDTLKSMTNLAVVSFYQNRLEDAEALFAEVLDIQRRVLGPAHPTTLGSANNLAVIQERLGHHAEAEALHREVLAQKREVLGPSHPETLSSAYNLAVLSTAQGKLAEAERLHAQTLSLRRQTLGESSPDTLDSWTALAGVAALAGDRDLAMTRLRQAVAAGYSNADALLSDADFAALRDDPEFLGLVQRAADGG